MAFRLVIGGVVGVFLTMTFAPYPCYFKFHANIPACIREARLGVGIALA